MYKCLNPDCGHLFEDGEEKVLWSDVGEKTRCCPVCGDTYDEAVRCSRCGEWHTEAELYDGICRDCIAAEITPESVIKFCKWDDCTDRFAQCFFGDWARIFSSSALGIFERGVLSLANSEKLSGETKIQDICHDFILCDDCRTAYFAEWMSTRDCKQDAKRIS